MKFTFCPYCGYKLNDEFAFCPKCGKRLPIDGESDETVATTSETVATTGETEDLFGGALAGVESSSDDFDFSLVDKALDEKIKEKEELDKKRKLIRVLCIRGKFDEATALCNELLESDPEDYAAYVGFVRIESKNYTAFEGEEIEKAVEVVRQIFSTDFDSDADFSAYLKKRGDYFAEKKAAQLKAEEERKAKAEAEKKAKEEADRKAKEGFEIEGTTLKKFKKQKYVGEVVIPDGITVICKKAFCSCSLTSVKLPDSVKIIDESAFGCCYSLTRINIPNSVVSIGKRAFYYCKSLVKITIPDGVTSIADEAFSACYSLTSVTIPGSVKSIGDEAFIDCSLESITIPGSVKSIGKRAFMSDAGTLTKVVIMNGVKSIGEGAFSYCEIESVTIPSSVTSIGEGAFDCCDDIYYEGSASRWDDITDGEMIGYGKTKIHFKN